MRRADQRVDLRRFIMTAELLDLAFASPDPLPDHFAHECELAEQALDGLTASPVQQVTCCWQSCSR